MHVRGKGKELGDLLFEHVRVPVGARLGLEYFTSLLQTKHVESMREVKRQVVGLSAASKLDLPLSISLVRRPERRRRGRASRGMDISGVEVCAAMIAHCNQGDELLMA
eukprot:7391585-Prymnesium_polylepis.2